MASMKKMYLGMALKGTPDWWHTSLQAHVRQALACLEEFEVTEFVGLTGADPEEIYTTDISLAKSADVMVALTQFPSIGLGMEIQSRIDLGKLTILCHPEGEPLSSMVLGAPGVRVIYYNNSVEDMKDIAVGIVQQVRSVI